MNRLIIIIALTFFLSIPASAKLFRNAYVSFELPPNWKCSLEGTEWICVSKFSKRAKEAIVILTAKEVGPIDNFSAYQTHLKTPRTLPDKNGKPTKSKVLHVRTKRINDFQWVDGMHLGSEISTYYTRYLATVKDRIAILVTFSAHKLHYTKYSNDFLKAIQSLRVVATKDILQAGGGKRNTGGGLRGKTTAFGAGGDPFNTDEFPMEDSSGDSGGMGAPLGALALGGAGYWFWRRKKLALAAKKRTKRSSSKKKVSRRKTK